MKLVFTNRTLHLIGNRTTPLVIKFIGDFKFRGRGILKIDQSLKSLVKVFEDKLPSNVRIR